MCWIWSDPWPSTGMRWSWRWWRRRRPGTAPSSWCTWGDGETGFRLELTWLRDRTEPYDLGEQEFHLAFVTDRFDALLARHRAMGCVCFENPDMGVYFIEDPDGYWIELVPERG